MSRYYLDKLEELKNSLYEILTKNNDKHIAITEILEHLKKNKDSIYDTLNYYK